MPEVRPIDGNDLIRRKDAENALEALALQVSDSKMRTVAKCVNALHFVPAVDAVPVVRCKDCRLWMPVGKYTGKCPFLIGENQYTGDDHYCSCGERREDDG